MATKKRKQLSNPQPQQSPEKVYTFTETTLDLIKYNLYLIFRAVCANAVAAPGDSTEKIAEKAHDLASKLDKKSN